MPEVPRAADRDPAHARAPLPRHAGRRVHDRGGDALHAADAQREAAGAGGGAGGGRHGRARACSRREEALAGIDAGKLDALLHPTFDPSFEYEPLAQGVARLAGRGEGRDRLHGRRRRSSRRRRARRSSSCGRSPRPTTSAGFHAARGILTSEGGKASHAALVARGMGRPCVCRRLRAADRPRRPRRSRVNGTRARSAGDLIAIDGTHGQGDDRGRAARRAARSASTSRRCSNGPTSCGGIGVRANADTPGDARRAREFGAEGIGLCRTEHMFMQADRQPKMRAMIMADTEEERRAALDGAAAAPARATSRGSSRRWRACR